MKITLYKDLHSYYFHTHELEDLEGQLIEGILYDSSYRPIGRIATKEDLEREENDRQLEFGS